MMETRGAVRKWLLILTAALLAAAVLLYFLLIRPSGSRTPEEAQGVQVLLDGEPAGNEKSIHPGGTDLRVYITLNGEALLDLPFTEAHTVRIVQPDGGENTVTLTGTSVYMTEANCEGQDCVQMGEVTRENLEVRVMGGFIICLPHRISVEVR